MINFKDEIIKILDQKLNEDKEVMTKEEISNAIEVPPTSDMGDYAFPVFSLAKVYRKNPNLISKEIAESIKSDYFEKVESKSAYINFFINKEKLAQTVIDEVITKGEEFGKEDVGQNKNVVIEYSSPNIAKPFHIGHIRSTVIGDSIKRIYKFLGYNTISYNHLGDYGTQFGMLIVAIKKWGNREEIAKNPIPELLKLYVKINQEVENDQELRDECRSWFAKLEKGDEEAVELWKWIREVSLLEFNRVYKMLDIQYDTYKGESFYSDLMQAEVDQLKKSGALVESEGAQIVDLSKYDLPVALIIKSDGSTIYITRDIAAAHYRHEEHKPYKNIYVVGSQQTLHFQQLKAILKEMGYDWSDEIVHVPFGMVSLEDGTLSTRKGRVVYLEDVLNKATEKVKEILSQREEERGQKIENKDELAAQVGIGAIKFQELFNQRIKDYMFSWDKTLSFDGETGPYVQYAHARIASLLEKGGFDKNAEVDYKLLKSEDEHEIIKTLYNFTNVVIDAHEKYEPYFITRYVGDLARLFNRYYGHTQIITDEDSVLKNTRLMLCYGVKNVLKEGLYLLGIQAPEKM
ncbi:arginine--tRNA ligase [Peptoniphilus obesi]|uniref:arginine--tRNA ligase n=1 Tax=Peptoniphilus obesi TaxID=1472765 RepID=UPI0004B5A830|nr:arginine--tRNA ligase [Peptoniphilus obesi]